MRTQSFRTVAAGVLGAVLLLGAWANSSSRIVLVRIDQAGLAGLPASLACRILAHAELEDGWIASLPLEFVGPLRGRRIRIEILDVRTPGRSYFLLDIPPERDLSELDALGRSRPVEGRTVLFWTEDGREPREILPADIRIKSLSLEAARDVLAAASPGLPARVMGRLFRPPVYDPRIADLVGQVSAAGLSADILALQNFQTRYASTAACELAGDFLFGYFSALGLKTEAVPFTFATTRSSRNIVAVLPGRASPEYVVLVCAHYDSYSGGGSAATLAPGADDNASGTAAVMEIARIFAGRGFDFTVKLICFSAEEWGLYGSKDYAQKAKQAGEKILGVLNMDMIAYPDRLPEDLDIIVNKSSEWLANWFAVCARQYAPIDLARTVNPSFRSSDHSPFWDQGFSALCAIEDASVPNPYYHKTTDLLSTLNMDFAASVTRIVLAVAAGLSQPRLQ